jgi:ligand-binding sensor domain-containing protein
MKRTLLFSLLLLLNFAVKASSPQWINYTSQSTARKIYDHNGALWIATLGGVVKYDKTTGDKTYFNKANAGIPSNMVEDITSDDAGNIWIGTYDAGIAMFDGKKWITFNAENSPLPSNAILNLETDKSGNIWVGGHAGLAKIGKNGWTIYTSTTAPDFKFDDVWSLAVDKNNGLWIGGSGLYYFKDSTWTDYSSDVNIYGIIGLSTNANGNVIATGTGGVFEYSNNAWDTIGTGNDFPALHSARYSTTDKDGNIWVTTTAGLFKFDGKSWTEFPFSSTLDAGAVCADANGDLWSAGVSGLNKFVNNKWQNVAPLNNSILSYYIKNILSDKAGAVWVNVTNALSRYTEEGWENLSPQNSELPGKDVAQLRLEKPGSVWICSSAGLTNVVNNKWTTFNTQNSKLPSNDIKDIAFDKTGAKWIIHNLGITIVTGTEWKQVANPASFKDNEFFKNIAIDKNNIVWLGTILGNIYRYENNTWTRFSLDDKTFAGGAVLDMKIDESTNTLWVGTWGGGLNYFDGTAWQTSTIEENIIVSAIWPDKNRIWSGTSHPAGLRVSEDGKEIDYFNSKNSPLPLKEITALELDEHGNMWIGTSDGVVVYKTGESANIPSEEKPVTSGFGKLYPNPANAQTTLLFNLGKAAQVKISIADITGRTINTLPLTYLTAGEQRININTTALPAGTYIVKLTSDNLAVNYKLILDK